MDPAELRLKNFIKPEQFPYQNKTGWEYDSGDYEPALRMAMEQIGYDDLRREQEEKRARGELMGIGVSFFTETVGAGPRKHMDILGLGMADGAEVRVHPTGKAVVRLSVQTQGQGHETTFAQIVGRGARHPARGHRRRPRRHRPDPVRPGHLRQPLDAGQRGGGRAGRAQGAGQGEGDRGGDARDPARGPGVGEGPLLRQGRPVGGKTIQEIALGAHGTVALPEGIDGNLDAEVTYDPPNLTFPFGAYICVVDVDAGTGKVKVRRFVAVDDCGTRINPMIVEGQIHGGLADGVGMALMEFIGFDEQGNCLGGSFMDYLIPTAMEVPDWETGYTVTPSPHHPIGAKGIGESATVGSPPAVVNAVVDALAPFGVTPHGHALHPGARVGGHAGPAPPRRSEGARSSVLDTAAELARDAGAVRAGDRRPRAEADQRARRRHRAGARRRRDRRVRRRHLRRGVGARVRADGAVDQRAAAAADRAGRGRRGASRGGRGHRRQPVPVRRLGGDLPGAARARAAGARRRRQPDRRGAGRARPAARLRRRAGAGRGGATGGRRRRARRRLARPGRGAGADRRAAARGALRRADRQPDPRRRRAGRPRRAPTSSAAGCTARPGWTSARGPRPRSRCRCWPSWWPSAGAAETAAAPHARRRPSAARPGVRHDRRGRRQLAARRPSTASTTWFCGEGCRTRSSPTRTGMPAAVREPWARAGAERDDVAARASRTSQR